MKLLFLRKYPSPVQSSKRQVSLCPRKLFLKKICSAYFDVWPQRIERSVSQQGANYLTLNGRLDFHTHPCVCCCLFIDGRCLVEWGGMDEDEDAGDSAKAVHRETISQVLSYYDTFLGLRYFKWKASK